jgi:hypothetical protein
LGGTKVGHFVGVKHMTGTQQMLQIIDKKTKIHSLILLFWAFFWLLNGGDKFFNGEFTYVDMPGVTRAVIVNENMEKVFEIKAVEVVGWFGVNRDAKIINYFQRLYLPPWSALISLYTLALLEVFLGVIFSRIFIEEYRKSRNLNPSIKNRTIHRLAFKFGIIIFIIFTIFDIILGDRAELWEHGCFMILYLVSYDLWYRTDRYTMNETGA